MLLNTIIQIVLTRETVKYVKTDDIFQFFFGLNNSLFQLRKHLIFFFNQSLNTFRYLPKNVSLVSLTHLI